MLNPFRNKPWFLPVCAPPGWLSGEHVGLMTRWMRVPQLRQTFFPAYFRFSALQKHVKKVVDGFGKKSCVSAGVRKPGNTCFTDCHDMTLAVKAALNPNTTNQLPDCSTSLLKTLWEKEKLLITSNFSFFHSVSTLLETCLPFSSNLELPSKLFQFIRVFSTLL